MLFNNKSWNWNFKQCEPNLWSKRRWTKGRFEIWKHHFFRTHLPYSYSSLSETKRQIKPGFTLHLKAKAFMPVQNGHICPIIERDEVPLIIQMGKMVRTFWTVNPRRHSWWKVMEVVVWRMKKRAWERTSNPLYSHTTTHLANHCVKWLWLSGCLKRKVTKIVGHGSSLF